MVSFVCSCGRECSVDVLPRRGEVCFQCHVAGIRFGFTGGGSFGKQAFHDMTVRERQEMEIRGAAETGTKLVPVSQRAELL